MGELFSYADVERREHALRSMRKLANSALARLSGAFAGLHFGMWRPSIAPVMLLRVMLLQAFYSIRSE